MNDLQISHKTDCQENKLVIFSSRARFEKEDSVWVKVTPFEQVQSRDVLWLKCSCCEEIKQINHESFNSLIFQERKLPNKVCLDLDHTLISAFDFGDDYSMQGDFSVKCSDRTYQVLKRPFLNEFIKFLFINFESVEVMTAGSRDYAEKICKNIGLSAVKITSRESLDLNETEMNPRETDYIKQVNDSVVIDDKTHIFKGSNLVILNPKPFLSSTSDSELLKIMTYIKTRKD